MNYNLNEVLKDLGNKVDTAKKTVLVDGTLGLKKLGKVDFLKLHGYKIIYK